VQKKSSLPSASAARFNIPTKVREQARSYQKWLATVQRFNSISIFNSEAKTHCRSELARDPLNIASKLAPTQIHL
jgi:hypothetical protein